MGGWPSETRSLPDGRHTGLFHNDGGHHRGMNFTVVGIGSCFGEGKAEGVPGREVVRVEGALISGNGMRHSVVVCPGDFSAYGDSQRRRAKGEISDAHSRRVATGRSGRRCWRRIATRWRAGGSSCSGGRTCWSCRGGIATGHQEDEQGQGNQAKPGCSEEEGCFLVHQLDLSRIGVSYICVGGVFVLSPHRSSSRTH